MFSPIRTAATTALFQSKSDTCWMENLTKEWAHAKGPTALDESARWTSLAEAKDAQDAIEVARAEHETKTAAPTTPRVRRDAHATTVTPVRCDHSDYDANGVCYSCGKTVVRGVGSYL